MSVIRTKDAVVALIHLGCKHLNEKAKFIRHACPDYCPMGSITRSLIPQKSVSFGYPPFFLSSLTDCFAERVNRGQYVCQTTSHQPWSISTRRYFPALNDFAVTLPAQILSKRGAKIFPPQSVRFVFTLIIFMIVVLTRIATTRNPKEEKINGTNQYCLFPHLTVTPNQNIRGMLSISLQWILIKSPVKLVSKYMDHSESYLSTFFLLI